jgi:hypothetical protein
MRAAFLFSGQLRGFPVALKNFKNHLFSAFDKYDTFFYIPSEDAKVLLDTASDSGGFNLASFLAEKDQLHPEIPNFQNNITYSLGKIEANGYEAKGRMQHYYLQWYGVHMVYNLFEKYKSVEEKKYDVVFRVRTDLNFKEPFTYEPFDGIQIPNYNAWGGIYDRFAYGSVEDMKYYCSLYENLKTGKYNECKHRGNSESKLRQHLESGNINIKIVNNVKYERINKDGTLQCMEH